MTWQSVNVNARARVKLMPGGIKILENLRDFMRANFPKQDWSSFHQPGADGWLEMQLWEIMHIFGDELHMGPQPPFETEFQIEAHNATPDRL